MRLWRFLRRRGYGHSHRAQRRIVLEISARDSQFERRIAAVLAEAVHGRDDEGGDTP